MMKQPPIHRIEYWINNWTLWKRGKFIARGFDGDALWAYLTDLGLCRKSKEYYVSVFNDYEPKTHIGSVYRISDDIDLYIQPLHTDLINRNPPLGYKGKVE
ncbi:MAG: hypothetical protein J6I64_00790 [Lachnospiraceae bacterium]|nr:hypothetical protein [Lachnospiraceae bacterium]